MHLGRVGLWTFQLDLQPAPRRRGRPLAELEELGYGDGVAPRGGGPRAVREQRELLLARTAAHGASPPASPASGAATPWRWPPATARSRRPSPAASCSGLGVSHQPMVEGVRGHHYEQAAQRRCASTSTPWTARHLRRRPGRPTTPRRVLGRPRAEDARAWPPSGPPAPTRTSSRSSTPPSPARHLGAGPLLVPRAGRRAGHRPRRRPGPPPASTWPSTSACRTTRTTCAGWAGATTTSTAAAATAWSTPSWPGATEAAIVARVQAHLDAGRRPRLHPGPRRRPRPPSRWPQWRALAPALLGLD